VRICRCDEITQTTRRKSESREFWVRGLHFVITSAFALPRELERTVKMSQNYVAFRLRRGDDLKKSINLRAEGNQAFIVSCCVGCLYEAHLRMAGGDTYLKVCILFEFLYLCADCVVVGAVGDCLVDRHCVCR
jgi:hypothetical protein